jgi:plastocyanin
MIAPLSRLLRCLAVAAFLSLVFSAAFPFLFSTSSARAAKTWGVTVYGDTHDQNYVFTPSSLTIDVGDSVNWTCTEGTHTTTSLPNQVEWWDSGPLTLGQSFAFAFTVPGTYNYTSLIDADMYGTIVVQQPTPEYPGYAIAAVVAMAALLSLVVERKLRS